MADNKVRGSSNEDLNVDLVDASGRGVEWHEDVDGEESTKRVRVVWIKFPVVVEDGFLVHDLAGLALECFGVDNLVLKAGEIFDSLDISRLDVWRETYNCQSSSVKAGSGDLELVLKTSSPAIVDASNSLDERVRVQRVDWS